MLQESDFKLLVLAWSISIDKNSTVNASSNAAGFSTIQSATITNANLPTGTGATNWFDATVTALIPNDGTANSIRVTISQTAGESSGAYYEVAQAQLELGSIKTTFKRAGGTIQGELAACQRYFETTDYALVTSPNLYAVGYWKVNKRVSPTITVTTISVGSGGNVGVTAYNPTSSFWLTVYNSSSGQCAISGSAEL
jgi:hypothetical protein